MEQDKKIDQAIENFPQIYFDSNETLLPIKIGYKVYQMEKFTDFFDSPSFQRTIFFLKEVINTEKDAKKIIEYSLLYEADISHLYELEHIWTYLDEEGEVIKIEASAHGTVQTFGPEDKIIVGPGKHSHQTEKTMTDRIKALYIYSCEDPGKDGLYISGIKAPSLFSFRNMLEDKYKAKGLDELIKNYLQKYKFRPCFNFEKPFIPSKEIFMSWEEFEEYLKNFLVGQITKLIEKE